MLAGILGLLFRTLIYFAFLFSIYIMSVSTYIMSVRVKAHPKWEDRIVTTVTSRKCIHPESNISTYSRGKKEVILLPSHPSDFTYFSNLFAFEFWKWKLLEKEKSFKWATLYNLHLSSEQAK